MGSFSWLRTDANTNTINISFGDKLKNTKDNKGDTI